MHGVDFAACFTCVYAVCDFEYGYRAEGTEVNVPGPTTEEECACLAKKVKGAVGASIKNEYCYAKFEKVGYTGRQSHYGCDFDDINDGEFKFKYEIYFIFSKSENAS